MKLFSVKLRVVFSFLFFFMLAVSFNAEAATKIDATTVDNYIKSMGVIYKDMSKKETEKFMISVNTLLFWEALRSGVVANGGTLKELDKSLDSDNEFRDLIKSTLSFLSQGVKTMFSKTDFSEKTVQKTLNDMSAELEKLKGTSKEKYDITVTAVKSLNGKSVKKVIKEADAILKRFDIKN